MSARGVADPMVPEVFRVARARRELADVWTLDIDPGTSGFMFAPGQFNMLYAFGIGEVAVSISGDPAKPETLIHTIRDVGKVSAALARLKPGDWLGVRGPFGHGWPVEAAVGSDVVVVAGGLGLAPLRPSLYRLFAGRDHYGRIVLLSGARSPAGILFRTELERWRTRLDIDVEVRIGVIEIMQGDGRQISDGVEQSPLNDGSLKARMGENDENFHEARSSETD